MKLDDLVAKRIVDAIADGASRSAAAEAARVHRATLLRWLALGREGDPEYRDFHDRVKKAEAEAEIAMVKVVRTAATDGTWQAAAWWLERCRPEVYAKREPVAIEGETPKEDQAGADLDIARSVVAALESRRTGT